MPFAMRLAALPILLAMLPGAIVAQQPVPILVSTDWLQAHLKDAGLVVVHTSQQGSDYEAGHVPGARWLPPSKFLTSRNGLSNELPDASLLESALEQLGIGDRSRIIIAGGPLTTVSRLYFTLDYFGIGGRTSILDGGIDAWREEGRAVEHATPVATRARLTLHANPARRADAAWIMAHATPADARVDVLDARLPEFYGGFSANNMSRAGRLPMAHNVPYSWLSGALTRFRDAAALERLFALAGVQPGDTVVTYCHTGVQASVLYVAARLLGHDAAVYDGAFEDWSKRTELPVASDVPPPRRP